MMIQQLMYGNIFRWSGSREVWLAKIHDHCAVALSLPWQRSAYYIAYHTDFS